MRRMTGMMAHRGPDSEGLERFSGAVLGHRRLSIFDLSDLGRQPMNSPDGEVSVVFNGAIYNFRELREELVSHGYAFRSQTDTEVLLHGYRHWGFRQMLQRLRGMFAIVLWDQQRESCWIVRDRLGVKPLYFQINGESLHFASTARALRASSGIEGKLNPEAVLEFLDRGYITDQLCIWQGMEKLGAGELLHWQKGRPVERGIYWEPPKTGDASPRFEEAVEETERLFLRAVERRLDADVAVGALLSAGVDSSLVCWAIQKLGGDVTAFTVSTPGHSSDEAPAAAAFAKAIGLRHQIISVSSQEPVSIESLTGAYGEPFAAASALGMLRVSASVREKATVLLTGDGGDDIFLGYPEHRACRVAQSLAAYLPETASALPGLLPRGKGRTLLSLATGGVSGWRRLQTRLPFYRQERLLGPALEGISLTPSGFGDGVQAGRRALDDFLIDDRRTRFSGEYLTKVDGGTMWYALEARSPFLDQDLWEFAARLPYSVRLRNGQQKAILRSLALQRLGPEVAQRAKQGFTIPVTHWMSTSWKAQVKSSFADSLLARGGWVNGANLAACFEANQSQPPLQLWYLYVLESWLRREESLQVKI